MEMTVQQLINILMNVTDKSQPVHVYGTNVCSKTGGRDVEITLNITKGYVSITGNETCKEDRELL